MTLKPELEKLIADEVHSGRASDAGEFLNRAVYHYALARDLGEDYSSEAFDEMIAAGLRDIDSGELIDGEEASRHLRALNSQRRNTPRTPREAV